MKCMKTNNRNTGDKGEDFAIDFFKKEGFEILDRNYSKPWGEIDIVAKKNKVIYFIEVKTVFIGEMGDLENFDPLFNIDKNKKNRLRKVIQTYLKDKKEDDSDYQVDAVAVYLKSDKSYEIERVEDIFL